MAADRWPPGGGRPPININIREIIERFLGPLRGQRMPLGGIGGLVVLALAAILLWSSWFTVQPEETGVVQRFGKVVRTVGPGLHFKIPYWIETVLLVPTARVLKEEFGFRTVVTAPGRRTQYADGRQFKGESLMLSGDLNVIDVQWIVQYRIEDPVRFLFQIRETPQTIRDLSEAVMRQVVGNRLGSDVLTVGRVAVSTEVRDEMQMILNDYGAGVRLVTVELQDVTPPDPVKPAFNEVNEARQDRERTINQAQEQVRLALRAAVAKVRAILRHARSSMRRDSFELDGDERAFEGIRPAVVLAAQGARALAAASPALVRS